MTTTRTPQQPRVASLMLPAIVLGGWLVAVAPAQAVGPVTFVVNVAGDAHDLNLSDNTCDSASKTGRQCTLRAAIEQADQIGGPNIIHFHLPATSLVITPATLLPPITDDGITIDGYSQTGAAANTKVLGDNAVVKVVIDGVNAGAGAAKVGLLVEADNATIRGLDIQHFGGFGIKATGSTDTISGNLIGTNTAGTKKRGNGAGVDAEGPHFLVGGTAPGDRNVVSGNLGLGILAGTSGGQGTDGDVYGNYIGTTKSGLAALGNGGYGVIAAANSNTIGSSDAGASNVISANGQAGVELVDTDRVAVVGNLIGTRADGTGDLGNQGPGLIIDASTRNVIASNTISHNSEGIHIFVQANGNAVSSNTISANDGFGIYADSSALSIRLNTITGNGAAGVAVAGNTTAAVQVLSNIIGGNAGLGIDLMGGTEDSFGVTANDVNDPDTGVNNLQNYPVIQSATRRSTGLVSIDGYLDTDRANATYLIQLFVVSADPSGHGEGTAHVEDAYVTTNAFGDAEVHFSGSFAIHVTDQVTETATDPNLNTSEFSTNRTVQGIA